VRRTPIVSADDAALCQTGQLVLKLEHLQHTGSFKPRGVFNSILSGDVPAAGVAAVSGGNHGAAIGYAAGKLGVGARVFVPSFADATKVDRIRGYGTDVQIAETMAAAFEECAAYCRDTGALFIHPWDQERTIEGQGTIGVELEEQEPRLDTLLVAVGGAGLIAGIATWFEGRVRLIGVESEGTASLAAALRAGRPSKIVPAGIAASALGAPEVGALGFEVAQRYVETVLTVSDADIREAQVRLWSSLRLIAEPGGVTALAALTSGRYVPRQQERVGVLICGGNAELGWFVLAPLSSAA
jgi:threonine dehydratase